MPAHDLARRLERLIARDVGRGIAPLAAATAGGLGRAAASLDEARAATIVTGFYIPAAMPPGAETDGPIGAAFIARALLDRGVPVHAVTDAPCAPVVEAALAAMEVAGRCTTDVVAVPGFVGGEPLAKVLTRHDEAPPSHVVAIERCGPGAGGVPRNARGEDIGAHTAPLERFFTPPAFRIGIGDGGNELGMGALPAELIAANVRHGAVIACRVPADALVVAGVSNWAGAALALLLAGPEGAARFDADAHDRVLDAMLAAGAVDGVRRVPARSVDALDAGEHRALIAALVAELRAEARP